MRLWMPNYTSAINPRTEENCRMLPRFICAEFEQGSNEPSTKNADGLRGFVSDSGSKPSKQAISGHAVLVMDNQYNNYLWLSHNNSMDIYYWQDQRNQEMHYHRYLKYHSHQVQNRTVLLKIIHYNQ